MNIQRLFGSERTLKTVEDFTSFEQCAAYFDGDICMTANKGVNVLEKGSLVHVIGGIMAILDIPSTPKLDIYIAYSTRSELVHLVKIMRIICRTGKASLTKLLEMIKDCSI